MKPLKLAGILAVVLLPGCTESLNGYPTYSSQSAYASRGYYGAPGYPASDYSPLPGYYQTYPTPFVVGPSPTLHEDWREYEHERRGYPPLNGGQQFQRYGDHHPPPPPMPPRPGLAGASPRPMAPPPAAKPPANQQLDQLGFRPSR